MQVVYVAGFDADTDHINCHAGPGVQLNFFAPKGEFTVGQTIEVTVS